MPSLDFSLWPKQLLALTTEAQCVLYGGAAGGGKSHVCRVASVGACLQVPGCQVFLFRRHYNDLIQNHLVGPSGFRALLQPLVEAKEVDIVADEIRFKNGSIIHLCHCQYDQDVEKYRGAEIHFFIPEEATQFSEYQLRFLLSRVRVPDSLPIPILERHKWPKVLMATNPGGIGHSFIKSQYIDRRPPMEVWKQEQMDGGRTCVYIPARLDDNPSINPEEYRAALMGLKRPELIDAMLNGSWEVPLGAAFPEADERRHVVHDHEIPSHLLRFRTFDWGSASPFSVQWWAVADSSMQQYPKGALILYREWYGCNPVDETKGLGFSNQQMCDGIIERSPPDEKIMCTVTDARPFQSGGGLKIADEFERRGVLLTLGDQKKGSRIQKWQQLRSRLIGEEGRPYIYFFKTCPKSWLQLTEVQTDAKNVEDIDTDQPDHAVDAIGHACQTWPVVKELIKPHPVIISNEMTFNQAIQKIKKHKQRSYANQF